MIQHSRRERGIAVLMAGLAGFVDALAFLEIGGYFVSFMSGNTTRLGAAFAENPAIAALPAVLILIFVTGVIGGTFVARKTDTRRALTVMTLVTVMLGLAALTAALGHIWLAIALMAAAMGAENAAFERNGEVSIGVTYMTGALVKLGQRVAAALAGGDRWSWVWYLALWCGLAGGAIAGALIYVLMGIHALWLASGFAAAISLLLLLERPAAGEGA